MAVSDMESPWIELAAAPWRPRRNFGLAALDDGSVLLCGGACPGRQLNDVWHYVDGVWTELEVPPWQARHSFRLAALHDGSVLLCGGIVGIQNMNDVWRFANGVWTELAAGPWQPRRAFGLTALHDGSALLCGGTAGTYNWNDVWLFMDGSWSELPAAPWAPRMSFGLTTLSDGSLLLCGGVGRTSLNDVWRFAVGSWTELPTAPWQPRMSFGLAALSDGSMLLCGGVGGEIGGCGVCVGGQELNDVWLFIDGVWTELSLASWLPRVAFGLAALGDGSVLLFGGVVARGCIRNDVWRTELNRAVRIITCSAQPSDTSCREFVSCTNLAGDVLATLETPSEESSYGIWIRAALISKLGSEKPFKLVDPCGRLFGS